MECSRCGRCCIEFAHQIHFLIEEPLIRFLLGKESEKTQEIENFVRNVPLLSIFQQLIPHFTRKRDDKDAIFVPTKGELLKFLPQDDKIQYSAHPSEYNHCMFLAWEEEKETKEKLPICLIQAWKPEMCTRYPEKKGWACLNHLDRRYSRYFLKYQKSQIGQAVEVIRKLHEGKISQDIAYDILTILMDFGGFELNRLKSFFMSEMNYTDFEFDEALSELASLSLVFVKDNCIEGIAMKDVEKVVDRIMHEMNWHYP